MPVRQTIEPVVKIGGEPFVIERDACSVTLSHRPSFAWRGSRLAGLGRTLLEAEMDVRYHAAILLREFPKDAQRLPARQYAFLMRIAHWNYVDKQGNCKCSLCNGLWNPDSPRYAGADCE